MRRLDVCFAWQSLLSAFNKACCFGDEIRIKSQNNSEYRFCWSERLIILEGVPINIFSQAQSILMKSVSDGFYSLHCLYEGLLIVGGKLLSERSNPIRRINEGAVRSVPPLCNDVVD